MSFRVPSVQLLFVVPHCPLMGGGAGSPLSPFGPLSPGMVLVGVHIISPFLLKPVRTSPGLQVLSVVGRECMRRRRKFMLFVVGALCGPQKFVFQSQVCAWVYGVVVYVKMMRVSAAMRILPLSVKGNGGCKSHCLCCLRTVSPPPPPGMWCVFHRVSIQGVGKTVILHLQQALVRWGREDSVPSVHIAQHSALRKRLTLPERGFLPEQEGRYLVP